MMPCLFASINDDDILKICTNLWGNIIIN